MSRRIVLGISGSIAAYKAAELVRGLCAQGHEVRVVMTQAAHAFISPLTLQALCGHAVRSGLFDPQAEAGMSHIALARWADHLLIAPATAHLIARLAHGLADDLLTTLALASTAPLSLAPAMNQAMWHHPATQDNIQRLQQRGVRILGPAAGDQACGDEGLGRMLEPAEIINALLAPRLLDGVAVLLTAGPTHEPLDPVRFIGNRSSGRMGFALAEALTAAGASVTLVAGPTQIKPPPVAELIAVTTAEQMYQAVMQRIAQQRIFIAAAAVADYRPQTAAAHKIKKTATTLHLELVRNPDILAAVAALPNPPFTVGFAAETEQLETQARLKLQTKRLNMIAANLVGGAQGGFEREDNALTVLWADGRQDFALTAKRDLAHALTALIAERYAASLTG